MSLEERALASLDSVSTETNIKGFTRVPPDGLKLYVKYRGDISPGQGQGREEAPLGIAPKYIEGTILDARIYAGSMRFMIALRVTKSDDDEDVGKIISIYPTRDRVSLYPFKSLGDLVKKKMKKNKIEKLKGYANIHHKLAFLPHEDDMAGRETIKAEASFKREEPVYPRTEFDHDDYQGEMYDNMMAKFAHSQDSSGYKHIGDDMLGGRRRRRKTRKTTRKIIKKTNRKTRKTHRRKRRKTKSIRRRKK